MLTRPSLTRRSTLARRVRAYVGLGANLGDPEATLAAAVHTLGTLPRVRLRGVSPLYATAPVGLVDQPEFRNAVVAVDVRFDAAPADAALELLATLKEIERRFGREPGRRWGPRRLDLDLLVFGRTRVSIERPPGVASNDATLDPAKRARLLDVPHRDAGERLFVLAPLADLAPRLVPPGWSESVASRRTARERDEGPAAVRLVGRWDGRRWRPAG